MGRILRKRRVGKEDTENIVLENTIGLALKSGSPPRTQKRGALMDKTNALKERRQNEGQDSKKAKKEDVSDNADVGRITRRRLSSKENVHGPSKSRKAQTESKPLGNKTNATEGKKLPPKAVDRKEAEATAVKETLSSDDVSEPAPLEARKQPPRNAAKFKEGWISELRSSRTSKESDKELKPASPEKNPIPQADVGSPPKPNKRGRRAAAVSKAGKGASPEKQPEGILESSSKSDDDEVLSQAVTDEIPVRKLPPRNASKFEDGWIASLRRSRNSKGNEGNVQKSPEKPIVGSKGDAKASKEKPKAKPGVRSRKVADQEAEADEENDSVPELEKAFGKPMGSGKTRSGRSTQETKATKSCKADTQNYAPHPPAPESKNRGLKDFESRIAAKLGIDMNATVPNTKNTVKSPEKPNDDTSSRTLRKRGVGKKIKYTEAEESSDIEKSPSVQSRVAKESPFSAKAAAKTSPARKTVPDKKSPPGSVSQKEKVLIPAGDKAGSKDDMKQASSPLGDPKPGCSWYPDATPLRKSDPTKIDKGKKTPLVPPTSSLFSIFKKPENPRKSSLENKIFVSSTKPDQEKKQQPVYGNPNMTPLKRTSDLSHGKKEELYDFEVDENEPKPKKRHKPIMKIQRVREVKRRKPKVYEADPETERRVLRNLDLSPSVLEEFRAGKVRKVGNTERPTAAQPSPLAHREASKSDERPDVNASEHHDYDIPVEPMSSPCWDYAQSTPMRDDGVSMFMNDTRDQFGRLSAKAYSPVKSKDSPIPVLMAEYNNDPVRNGDSSRRSVVSTASRLSGASGNSVYHDDLDISASTPVKFNKNDSTYSRPKPKPIELNLSNCFGFDEPEIVEEPLVSPIKSTVHVPTAAPVKPVPILKSKPPVMLPPPVTLAVDVDQVIKRLRFEVGDNSSADNSANISVYDDSEITLKSKSPIKRYFQPKETHKRKAETSAEETTVEEGREPFSPIKVVKVPRLSYERPSKLRKKNAVEPVYKETSEPESEHTDGSDTEHEPEHAEDIFKPTRSAPKKASPKKRGMTKKEEEELEKWAQMFNSQCNEIDSLSLVVE